MVEIVKILSLTTEPVHVIPESGNNAYCGHHERWNVDTKNS